MKIHHGVLGTCAAFLLFTFRVSAEDVKTRSTSPAPAESAATAPAASMNWTGAGAVSEADSLYEVKTVDGQSLSGHIVTLSDSVVVLRLQSGGKVTLDRRSVASIEVQRSLYKSGSGELWYRDVNRTRYLYSPSAFMLKRGEGSFSQKELMFSSWSFGVTDHLSLQVSSVVPAWFANDGFNLILGAKAGGSITDEFALAGGIQTFLVPASTGTLDLPFVSATVGDDRGNVTLTLSEPFVTGQSSSGFGDLSWYALCGNLRLGRRTALVTENWLFKLGEDVGDDEVHTVESLALRVFGEHIAVDVGAFFGKGFDIPIPWLDFTYNFGISSGAKSRPSTLPSPAGRSPIVPTRLP